MRGGRRGVAGALGKGGASVPRDTRRGRPGTPRPFSAWVSPTAAPTAAPANPAQVLFGEIDGAMGSNTRHALAGFQREVFAERLGHGCGRGIEWWDAELAAGPADDLRHRALEEGVHGPRPGAPADPVEEVPEDERPVGRVGHLGVELQPVDRAGEAAELNRRIAGGEHIGASHDVAVLIALYR